MHEVSICQSIIETIEAEMEVEQYDSIREVHLKIGELSCVDPNILSHVFGYIKEGGPFEHCTLHTEFVKVLVACKNCNANFNVEDYRFVCPVCHTPSSNIIEGNELKIFKIVLEEPTYAQVDQ